MAASQITKSTEHVQAEGRIVSLLVSDFTHDLSSSFRGWSRNELESLLLDIEAKLVGDRFKFGFTLCGILVNLECLFNLQRCQLFSISVDALHAIKR